MWCRSPGMAPRAVVWVAVTAVLLLGGAVLHRRHREDTRALVDVVTRGMVDRDAMHHEHYTTLLLCVITPHCKGADMRRLQPRTQCGVHHALIAESCSACCREHVKAHAAACV
jgi:hypothetical protein